MIKTNLDKLNSATKYPSIPTYHEIGDKGRLKYNVQVPFMETDGPIFTEKVDGTNARIIVFPGNGYFIGSREDLLTASGDLIYNPSMGIVEALRPTVETFKDKLKELINNPVVLFGEVYGAKVGSNGKNYTESGRVGFRLFDIACFESEYDLDCFLKDTPVDKIAAWRDNGGQKFFIEESLQEIATHIGVPLTPRIPGTPPPIWIKETMDWLKAILPGKTHAALDGAGGKPEGIVVRNSTRTKIAKIRFEDYERTIRQLQAGDK